MNNIIIHEGTKGQRWGVRHYQNYDGTFNDVGKKRYFGTKNPHKGWRKDEPEFNEKESVQTPKTAKSLEKNDNKNISEKTYDVEKTKKIATGIMIGVGVAALAYGGYKFATTQTGQRALRAVMDKAKDTGNNIRNEINIQRGRNQINRQLGVNPSRINRSTQSNSQNATRIHDSVRERARQLQNENRSGFDHSPEMREFGRSQARNNGDRIHSQLGDRITNTNLNNSNQNSQSQNRTSVSSNNRRNNRRNNRYDSRDREITNYRLNDLKNAYNVAKNAVNATKNNPYLQRDVKNVRSSVKRESQMMREDYRKGYNNSLETSRNARKNRK